MPSVQLGQSFIDENQKSAGVLCNEFFAALDAHMYLSVKDRDGTAPPGSPAVGDRYLVAASPSGAWTGWAGRIAVWLSSLEWVSYVPKEGWRTWVDDENRELRHNGTTWVESEVLFARFVILNPTISEKFWLGQATRALTIRRVFGVLIGTTSPSRTIQIPHGTDFSAGGTNLFSSGQAITSVTTGQTLTTFNDNTLAAGEHFWLTTSAGAGTVTQLAGHVEYTED